MGYLPSWLPVRLSARSGGRNLPQRDLQHSGLCQQDCFRACLLVRRQGRLCRKEGCFVGLKLVMPSSGVLSSLSKKILESELLLCLKPVLEDRMCKSIPYLEAGPIFVFFMRARVEVWQFHALSDSACIAHSGNSLCRLTRHASR